MSGNLFTKRMDKNGKFYHIINDSGEITYDIPSGDHIPLKLPPLSPLTEETNEIQRKERINRKERIKQERLELAQKIQTQHLKKETKLELQRKQEESERLDDLWRTACEASANNGSGAIGLNWRDIGYISQRIYDFEKNYSVELKKLS